MEETREKVKTYELINESAVVETSDGEPLLYFIKQGMFAPKLTQNWPKISRDLPWSQQAVEHFIAVCPPKIPKMDHPRHQAPKDKEKNAWTEKGLSLRDLAQEDH